MKLIEKAKGKRVIEMKREELALLERLSREVYRNFDEIEPVHLQASEEEIFAISETLQILVVQMDEPRQEAVQDNADMITLMKVTPDTVVLDMKGESFSLCCGLSTAGYYDYAELDPARLQASEEDMSNFDDAFGALLTESLKNTPYAVRRTV